jgi:hypothetical protein
MLRESARMTRSEALLRRLQHSFQTRRWQWLVSIFLFLTFNGYIAFRIYREWDKVQAIDWRSARLDLLGAALLVHFVGLLIAVGIWGYVLRQYGYQLPFRRHFKVYTIGALARKLPGGIGVDILSRVYYYGQDGGDTLKVSFATAVEPVVFAAAAAVVLLGSMLVPGGSGLLINPLVPAGALLLFLALLPSPPVRGLLARVSSATGPGQLRWQHLLAWAACNVLTLTLGGLTLFLFSRALGMVGDSAALVLVQYWAMLVLAGVVLVWMPVDIGVTSAITVLAFSTLMPMPQALGLLIAWRIWITLVEAAWGAVGFVL